MKGLVYSTDGNLVEEFSGNEIDLTENANGIYFFEARFYSGEILTGKLVKLNY